MNFGQRIVAAYFGLFYLVPLVGNIVFREQIETIYAVGPLIPYVVLLLVGTLGLFLFVSMGPRLRILPPRLLGAVQGAAKVVGTKYRGSRLLFAVVCLPAAFQFAASSTSSWRYSPEGISGAESSFGLLMVVLNVIVTVDLFYCMFVRPYERLPLLSRPRIENILLSLVLVMAANGTAGMLIGLLSLGYSLWPAWFYRNLFLPRRQGVLVKIRRAAVTLPLIAAVFGMAWVAGETIKMSSGGRNHDLVSASRAMWDYVEETPELVGNYGYYLISGFSTHYYALLFTAHAPGDLLNVGVASALLHPLQTLAFRIDYLTGGLVGVLRPEIGSLSRLNYVLLTKEPNVSSRQGTSPGLIASFNYIFPFPLNVLFCVAYLCWVASLISRLLSAHRHELLSGIGLLLLLLYVRVLFDSPFDFLLLLDDAMVFLVLLVGIALVPRSARLLWSTPGAKEVMPHTNALL